MRNPLNKRIPKEFLHDFGKYVVIFLFLVMLISLVSAFSVCTDSIKVGFREGVKTYNLEEGHLSFNMPLTQESQDALEEKGQITLYDLDFFEEDLDDTNKTLRVYKNRQDVDLVDVMEGRLPEAADEIAVDRLFARNNEIQVGDTISLAGRKLKLVGTVAFSDYVSLFENNSDSMFDSTNFTPALMTEEGYEDFDSIHQTINYAWTYKDRVDFDDDAEAERRSDDLIDVLEDLVKDYDEGVVDQAIADGKLVMLAEVLSTMEESGVDLSMFDSEDGRELLLDQIQQSLDDQGVDLTEEFSEVLTEYPDKKVELTTEDLKLAMDSDQAQVDQAQDYLDHVEDHVLAVEDYVPLYTNQAVNFAIDDVGGDSATFLVFNYIVLIVIAFVFAVTITNTISQEAGVIGTLRASGYSRGELLRHYMLLPILVTILAAIVGNILGYTILYKYMDDLERNSYSFTHFDILFNVSAFVQTTVLPLILMFLIDLWLLSRKLKLSPLRFLRHDLSKRGKKKAFRLNTKIPIMIRFRLRVIFQNISNYIILVLGVFLGAVLVVFGLMFGPLLDDYADLVVKSRLCDYQYVLMDTEHTTDNDQAEEFAMTSLKSADDRYLEEDISVYGIVEDSRYVKEEIPEGQVLVTNVLMKKYGLKDGDTYTLKDNVTGKEYKFKVAGDYKYDGALAVFMPIDEYRTTFGEEKDYFTGYFSNEEITDLDADDIATVITISDLNKITTQMKISMGDMMGLISAFGVIMFLLLMYILSKQIIEKNATSISMTKILGFKNGEIGGLYIVATSLVVIFALLISIPLTDLALRWVFNSYLYTRMSGYIPYIIDPLCYVKMVALGLVSYAVIAVVQLLKISRIPKADALKNVE